MAERGPRIVSLLPSATEIVCALGLEAQLVGVTHECDYPAAVRDIPKMTRTLIPTDADSAEIDRLVREQLTTSQSLYEIDFDALAAARPDLILSQTLCRVCAVSERELQSALTSLPGSPRVLYLEPTRLGHVFDNMQEVAAAAGVADAGRRVVGSLRERVERVRELSRAVPRIWSGRAPRVLVLEWLQPIFSSGHWTPELVALAGGQEPIAQAGQRSAQITLEQVCGAEADILVVACCGYSLAQTCRDAEQFLQQPQIANLRCVREGRVYAVDGAAYFSRPGPRLVDSLEILAHAIAPQVHPLRAELPAAYAMRELANA